MALIRIYDGEPGMKVERGEDGHVVFTIQARGDEIRLDVMDTQESASHLHDILNDVSAHLSREILDGWTDLPREDDAWVLFEDGKYYIRYAGMDDDDSYPTQNIATYELAAIMAARGEFGSAWFQNSRGIYEGIDTAVRAFHDEGGDKMLPLVGVQYEPGTEIRFTSDQSPLEQMDREVVKDYGAMGIVVSDGESTLYISGENRCQWQRYISRVVQDERELTPAMCGYQMAYGLPWSEYCAEPAGHDPDHAFSDHATSDPRKFPGNTRGPGVAVFRASR